MLFNLTHWSISMYYHFAILLLFRPLIKLRIIGSSILPRDVCAQAADAIQGLLRSYSQLYTLRRTPSFVPYFVLTSSIMYLAVGAEASKAPSTSTVKPEETETEHGRKRLSSSNRDQLEPASRSSTTAKLSPRVAEALNQGIAHLTEMAPCHHFAHQALNILQFLAKKWGIEVDIPPSTGVSEEPDNSVRPTTSSLNFFAPNVSENDYLCSWTKLDMSGPGGAQGRHGSPTPQTHFNRGEKMEGIIEGSQDKGASEQDQNPSFRPRGGTGPVAHATRTLENPLFWPFPMQGRPMLPEGKQLEEAGFRPL